MGVKNKSLTLTTLKEHTRKFRRANRGGCSLYWFRAKHGRKKLHREITPSEAIRTKFMVEAGERSCTEMSGSVNNLSLVA